VKKSKKIEPPRWARRFLGWYCRPELLEDLEGDLQEYFERNVQSKGKQKSRLIYIIDVIKFMRLYTIKKPQPSTAMNELIVFRNYFKTSLRNIARNKLFSTINMAGLAVSMCVGLILISLTAELKSFDNFHTKAERIFRVNNVWQERNGSSYNYASTSILTGKKIKESVTGVEQVVTISRGFNRDVQYKDKVIPLKGFWADESFFQVFSFGLISGNAATALKEPNALVLTESSAMKLFGEVDAVGKFVQIDSTQYTITAVVKDPPVNSHMRFDMLGSFITMDAASAGSQNNLLKWDNMWGNYVYILLPEKNDVAAIEKSLARISEEGNRTIENNKITLYLEPLREIALSRNMSNSIGPTVDKSAIVTMGILTLVVVISACFNYTNLSIARALRRTREVGIRKVIGASRRQVFSQFVFESTMLAILSLGLAYVLFLLIRPEFLAMSGRFQEMVTLEPNFETYLYFIGFAILVGILAGLFPASFFSKINAARILKDFSSIKLFGHVNLRKTLITFQYTLSILFIVAVSIGYKQYRYSLHFDLGFKTQNIYTLDVQGNNPDHLIKELSELPEVKQISKAHHVSSVGANYTGNVKYNDAADSTLIHYNFVDQEYLSLHEHKLLAGENFKPVLSEVKEQHEIIINERTVKWMQLSDPHQAIGEELIIDGQKNMVIGVIEDFHYERINYPIQNFAFRNDPKQFQIVSLKIESTDMLASIDKIQAVWKKFDAIHPMSGKFYQDYIHDAYAKLSWILKIIGTIAFLTISIASLGLLGMVIFTTEKRLKEISIRKVLGATEGNLVFLMSKGFLSLLIVSSAIAIPTAYYFMDSIVFGKIVYRAPIVFMDLAMGTLVVMGIAIFTIGTQTLKIARTNPAEILKNE
jgi:putative ABC transport system permease protein